MREPLLDHGRRPRIRLISGRLKVRKEVAEPLKRGVFLVPAAITSLGLLSGFYSLISSINHHFELAATMIVVAFICDGLDGRVARASRTSSQFGIEYDSLSDVIAFGVAPAGLVYMFALTSMGSLGWVLSGAYVVCAALRLARFNTQVGTVDKRRFDCRAVDAGIGVPDDLAHPISQLQIHQASRSRAGGMAGGRTDLRRRDDHAAAADLVHAVGRLRSVGTPAVRARRAHHAGGPQRGHGRQDHAAGPRLSTIMLCEFARLRMTRRTRLRRR
jgi:CDP-diacylglycerol--serine O-phosphatidyltransferase